MLKENAPPPFANIEAFRAAAAALGRDKFLEGAHVRASFETEVKASEEDGSRVLTFTISTPNKDRQGDTIKLDGWELENFRKNPVVLWAHNSSQPPIAKANRVWTESGKLKSDAEFVPADNPAVGRFADGIFQLYKGGFMSATSVGFAPMKYAFRDDPGGGWGIDFLSQELLEFSAVPVPANAEALIEGKSAGIDIAPVLDFCELALRSAKDHGRVVSLVESILGGNGQDLETLAWGEKIASLVGLEKIAAARGMVLMSRERVGAVERAATKQRLAEKRKRELSLAALSQGG